ncbi:hypothetical protein J6590_086327 [Homalodisca vitripennis]|nr:hypothetical protein J6590_086327 [Homalodisca vitripennis]
MSGLFSFSHVEDEADRDRTAKGDPSFAEMTRTALSVLMKNPRGFFLFMEGFYRVFNICKRMNWSKIYTFITGHNKEAVVLAVYKKGATSFAVCLVVRMRKLSPPVYR